ncbi:MAG: sigma-70 family RNA polymerase sigma factor [Thermoguttaceae bacterium]
MNPPAGQNQASDADRADAGPFAALLESCQRPVFLYAMALLHNAADAEEARQETQLVLWQKFDRYQAGTDFVRFACGIARNEALKIRARRPREKQLFNDGFLEILAAETQKAPDARQQALRHCLEKLSPADRDLVLRRYHPGGATRSVAQALGRSVQGTRKSLHRIRAALSACVRRTMSREGDE